MPTTVEAATVSTDNSAVTPVVLREELRPPQYGTRFTEVASRTFYTKYLEYERRVERANLGGAGKYQVASMAQLVDTPVQKVLARRFFNRSSITPQHLETAIKTHAGHEEGADVELSQAPAAVAKSVTMDSKGKTLLEKVEPIFADLEICFSENPDVERIYRSSSGKFITGPAAVITEAMVEGLKPPEFQRAVHVRLLHVNNWKADPYLVMDIMLEEAHA